MTLTEEPPKIVDLRMDMDTVIITFKQEDKTITLSFKSELIKQWKEDAKKWQDWNAKSNSAQLFDKYEKIVERLDKRIEELNEVAKEDFDSGHHNANVEFRIEELQKIRGEQK